MTSVQAEEPEIKEPSSITEPPSSKVEDIVESSASLKANDVQHEEPENAEKRSSLSHEEIAAKHKARRSQRVGMTGEIDTVPVSPGAVAISDQNTKDNDEETANTITTSRTSMTESQASSSSSMIRRSTTTTAASSSTRRSKQGSIPQDQISEDAIVKSRGRLSAQGSVSSHGVAGGIEDTIVPGAVSETGGDPNSKSYQSSIGNNSQCTNRNSKNHSSFDIEMGASNGTTPGATSVEGIHAGASTGLRPLTNSQMILDMPEPIEAVMVVDEEPEKQEIVKATVVLNEDEFLQKSISIDSDQQRQQQQQQQQQLLLLQSQKQNRCFQCTACTWIVCCIATCVILVLIMIILALLVFVTDSINLQEFTAEIENATMTEP